MSKSKSTIDVTGRDIPFSLDSLTNEKYFIELYPNNQEWLAATNAANPVTGKKIYECLVKKDTEEGEKWGLSLPKLFGLTTGERSLIGQGSNRQKAINNYLKLVVRIHNKTGISYEDLQPMLDRPFEYIDKLGDYIGELTSVFASINSDSNSQLDIVTIILKERLINSWDETDTSALCGGLFDALYDYVEKEQGNWEVLPSIDEEEKVGEASSNT